ncbi:fumarylacetoacetate hydrolase family protein [Undibacterium sp. SXout11W]|uniref:fumarylacetoacetate hydrolase family protein n=1 Tax=Undibacterium sp. SXout11W TaxID=3413050 RepID=UPI003BF44DF0
MLSIEGAPLSSLITGPESDHSLDAAKILAQRRLRGESGAQLPFDLRPNNIAEAMQIQSLLTSLLNDDIAGWKCGMPSEDRIVIAPIFSKTVFQQKQSNICNVHANDLIKIEPELAFILATNLPARITPYSNDDVRAAVSHAHLALEIIGCRYSEPAEACFYEHLADGLFNQGLFLGPEIGLREAEQAQKMPITLTIESDVPQAFDGVHAASSPMMPLCWLAEYLRQQGTGLRAGQAIITGSYAGSPAVPLDKNIVLQFAELGSIEVCFTQYL